MMRAISSIVLGARFRRDLGDLDALARNIKEIGLLHPIAVRPDGRLIAGRRRIEACKRLGWAEIPVHEVNLEQIIRGEFSENVLREPFSPSDMVDIKRALEPLEREAADKRRGMRTDLRGNSPEVGRATDKIAALLGKDRRTVEKAEQVVCAAEAQPEKFGDLKEEMDRKRSVNSAFRKLRQRQDQERVKNLAPIAGRYRTLVIDPPWDYEWLSLAGRAAPGYATMSHDELLALPVAEWAEENSHLYLWTTNNFMTRAVELMARWGFQHKTVLTWVKPRWGLGSYFRNSTEHVLFGVRGEMRTRSDSIATHFEAPMGGHSEKPEKFYEIVRAASYEPYGEAFQRQEREGFANVFGLPEAA